MQIFSWYVNDELRNNLWIKFKDGDNEALSKLYAEFAHELYSYGLKIGKNGEIDHPFSV